MTIYQHLAHALRIMREEPNWRKWAPLIDALTPEQQEEVRPWLRQEAERRGGRPNPALKASRPGFSANSSQTRKTTSSARKAVPT